MGRTVAWLEPILSHGVLAAWLHEWWAGRSSPEEVDDVLSRRLGVSTMSVTTLSVPVPVSSARDVSAESSQQPLVQALGTWRRDGPVHVRLHALAPGDPAAPVHPLLDEAAFRARALVELVADAPPTVSRALTLGPLSARGTLLVAERDPTTPPPPVEATTAARRALDEAMREATDRLLALDVARGDPALPAALSEAAHVVRALDLPASMPARAHDLLGTAVRLLVMLTVATEGTGGALTATAARDRADSLAPVSRTARRALEAAFTLR